VHKEDKAKTLRLVNNVLYSYTILHVTSFLLSQNSEELKSRDI